jgi:hypothetical protein
MTFAPLDRGVKAMATQARGAHRGLPPRTMPVWMKPLLSPESRQHQKSAQVRKSQVERHHGVNEDSRDSRVGSLIKIPYSIHRLDKAILISCDLYGPGPMNSSIDFVWR